MTRRIWIMSFLLLASLTPATLAAGIEMTTVRNAGNAADANGFGSVDYVYHISKHEVTVGQYVSFLNAVAAVDPHGLYDSMMMTKSIIIRSGEEGNYTYASAEGMANRPVTWVSFWDACRFANWLHNGSPTRAQDLLSTEDGAYFLNGETNPTALITREVDWRFAIASKNEWYKAAFHNASAGLVGSYHNYATGDTITTDMANYNNLVKHTTDVGLYGVCSDYGTFDQAGNVREWNDTLAEDLLPQVTPEVLTQRSLSDSSFLASAASLFSNKQMPFTTSPSLSDGNWGFRIVSMPEPCSVVMFLAGWAAVFSGRRRGQSRLRAK